MEEDCDLTQRVPLWFDDDDQDTEVMEDTAILKVFKQTGVPNELEFTLYKGVNKIGRGDSCEVCIKNQVLSKEHAVIEVGGDWFLIYDLGSANKTWRCKTNLKPNVRYKLEPNEELVFGNIRTQFVIKSRETNVSQDTDSETDSESMLLIKEDTCAFYLTSPTKKNLDEEQNSVDNISHSTPKNEATTSAEETISKSNEENKASASTVNELDSDDETDCEDHEDIILPEKVQNTPLISSVDDLGDTISSEKCKVTNASHLEDHSSVAPVKESECTNVALNLGSDLPGTFPNDIPEISKPTGACNSENASIINTNVLSAAIESSSEDSLPETQVNYNLPNVSKIALDVINDDKRLPSSELSENKLCILSESQIKKEKQDSDVYPKHKGDSSSEAKASGTVSSEKHMSPKQLNTNCFKSKNCSNFGPLSQIGKMSGNQKSKFSKHSERNGNTVMDEQKESGQQNQSDDDLPETQVCVTDAASTDHQRQFNEQSDSMLPETQVNVTGSTIIDKQGEFKEKETHSDDDELPETQVCNTFDNRHGDPQNLQAHSDGAKLPGTQVCNIFSDKHEESEDCQTQSDNDVPETQLFKATDSDDSDNTCDLSTAPFMDCEKVPETDLDSDPDGDPLTIPKFPALEYNIKSSSPNCQKNDLSPTLSFKATNLAFMSTSSNLTESIGLDAAGSRLGASVFGECSTSNISCKKKLFSGINISVEEGNSLEEDMSILCPSTQRRSDVQDRKVKNTDVYGSPILKESPEKGEDSIAETPPHLLEGNSSFKYTTEGSGIDCIRTLFKELPGNQKPQSEEFNVPCCSKERTLNDLCSKKTADMNNGGDVDRSSMQISETFAMAGKVNYASNCSPKVYKAKLGDLPSDQTNNKAQVQQQKERNDGVNSPVEVGSNCHVDHSVRAKSCEKVSATLSPKDKDTATVKSGAGANIMLDSHCEGKRETRATSCRTYSRKKRGRKSQSPTPAVINGESKEEEVASKRKLHKHNSVAETKTQTNHVEHSVRARSCEKASTPLSPKDKDTAAVKSNAGANIMLDSHSESKRETRATSCKTYSRKKRGRKSQSPTPAVINMESEEEEVTSKRKLHRQNPVAANAVDCSLQKHTIEKVEQKVASPKGKTESNFKSTRLMRKSRAAVSSHKADEGDEINDFKVMKSQQKTQRKTRNGDRKQIPVSSMENSDDANTSVETIIAADAAVVVKEIKDEKNLSDCPSSAKRSKRKPIDPEEIPKLNKSVKDENSSLGFCVFKKMKDDEIPEKKEPFQPLLSAEAHEMKTTHSKVLHVNSKDLKKNRFSPFKNEVFAIVKPEENNSLQPLSSRRTRGRRHVYAPSSEESGNESSSPAKIKKKNGSGLKWFENLSPRTKRNLSSEIIDPVVTMDQLVLHPEPNLRSMRKTRNNRNNVQPFKAETSKADNVNLPSNGDLCGKDKSQPVLDRNKNAQTKLKASKANKANNKIQHVLQNDENKSLNSSEEQENTKLANLPRRVTRKKGKAVEEMNSHETRDSTGLSINSPTNLPRKSGRKRSITPKSLKSSKVNENDGSQVNLYNELVMPAENFSKGKDSKKSSNRNARRSDAIAVKSESHTEKEIVKKKRTRLQECNDQDKSSEEKVTKRSRNSDLSSTTSNSISETDITPIKSKRGRKSSGRNSQTVQVTSPASRSFQRSNKPRVMFTMVEDEDPQKVVVSLGGKVVEDFNQCTHLVTDKMRRTVKALCCIAKGIPLVNTKWLQQCKKSTTFIDHTPFLIKDKAVEKQYGFQLQVTLEKAFRDPLLTAWSVHVTPKVMPGPEQMKDIIQCAGGKYLPKMPNRLSVRTVVISCTPDLNLCNHAAKCGVPIVGAEFLLTGLLRHEVDVKSYKL